MANDFFEVIKACFETIWSAKDVFFHGLLLVLGALCVVGNVVAWLTPTKVDDEIMKDLNSALVRFSLWLPKVGIGDRSRQMRSIINRQQEALKEPEEEE